MKNQVNTIYKQAERFAEITKKAIITGNINQAKKCLAIAEQLFKTGSSDTKIAITNVYVLSIIDCNIYGSKTLQYFQFVSKNIA